MKDPNLHKAIDKVYIINRVLCPLPSFTHKVCNTKGSFPKTYILQVFDNHPTRRNNVNLRCRYVKTKCSLFRFIPYVIYFHDESECLLLVWMKMFVSVS